MTESKVTSPNKRPQSTEINGTTSEDREMDGGLGGDRSGFGHAGIGGKEGTTRHRALQRHSHRPRSMEKWLKKCQYGCMK